jgi:hypothetical protein
MMKTMPDGFHTSCANCIWCIEVACMLLASDMAGKGGVLPLAEGPILAMVEDS